MHTSASSSSASSSRQTVASPTAAARAGLRVLQRMQHGCLSLELPDGSVHLFGTGATPDAVLRLRNWKVFAAVARSGDIGLAETYLAGDWQTSDLVALFSLFLRNRRDLEALVYGSWWGGWIHRLQHFLRRNTKRNSRKNIHAHYDLGNDFYSLWLDPSMNYSSAWFQGDLSRDLTQAQHAKIGRALQEANVVSGTKLLEIGCGWGALAEQAAMDHHATVTAVTLSTAQLEYAQSRVSRAGLDKQVALRLQDYRDITDGPYDAICSIEMLEAVGQSYWPDYFKQLHRLLVPGGKACIQSILIDDALFQRYLQGTDFIQQYIFPGGCLPSASRLEMEAAKAGLRVERKLCFGADYAETLRRWRLKFLEQHAAVLAQGFDQRFLNIWEFYLAYCEAAFREHSIDVAQYTLVRV